MNKSNKKPGKEILSKYFVKFLNETQYETPRKYVRIRVFAGLFFPYKDRVYDFVIV